HPHGDTSRGPGREERGFEGNGGVRHGEEQKVNDIEQLLLEWGGQQGKAATGPGSGPGAGSWVSWKEASDIREPACQGGGGMDPGGEGKRSDGPTGQATEMGLQGGELQLQSGKTELRAACKAVGSCVGSSGQGAVSAGGSRVVEMAASGGLVKQVAMGVAGQGLGSGGLACIECGQRKVVLSRAPCCRGLVCRQCLRGVGMVRRGQCSKCVSAEQGLVVFEGYLVTTEQK
ncbi:unnamed protein product, partial [Discosporangium mesarthrocarpum]